MKSSYYIRDKTAQTVYEFPENIQLLSLPPQSPYSDNYSPSLCSPALNFREPPTKSVLSPTGELVTA